MPEPLPRTIPKPWGHELWFAHTHQYAGKLLHVNAGHALSLQYHQHKDETSYLQTGQLLLTQGPTPTTLTTQLLGPGATWRNTPGHIHSIEAITTSVIIEVSTPQLDDVIRIQDRYGRQ